MDITRRDWLASGTALMGTIAGASATATASAGADGYGPRSRERGSFRYCLNTSTLQGHKLMLDEVVDIAIEAGYDAVEPWVRELDQHVKSGKSLKDLKKKFSDHARTIESVIGFFEWGVDDDARRKKALDEVERVMGLVSEVGGKRIAVPPVGLTDRSGMDPRVLADRLRPICELGERTGVWPELELWGFSRTLGRLGDVAQVAIETAHPNLFLLLDVYHLYKGGSSIQGVNLLNGTMLPVLHCNDYPNDPPRATITDAQRVYPGDGVAPLKDLIRILDQIRFQGFLSLELFNRDYWKQDPGTVARTGLEKMRAVVRNALS